MQILNGAFVIAEKRVATVLSVVTRRLRTLILLGIFVLLTPKYVL